MGQLSHKLGLCVICGDRVYSSDSYLKSSDGYCHRSCLTGSRITA